MSELEGMIVYEEHGLPIELHDEQDCRKAIESGSLRPDTLVQQYLRDGIVAKPAREVEPLRTIFALDEPDPPSQISPNALPPPKIPPDPAYTTIPAVKRALTPEKTPEEVRKPLEASAQAATVRPAPTNDNPPLTTTPPTPKNKIPGCVVPILIVLALLFGIGLLTKPNNQPVLPPVGSADNVMDATSEPAADPDAGAFRSTLYTVRAVQVQARPTSGPGIGMLARNTTVTGILVPGRIPTERWLKVKDEGPYKDSFIWAGNLSADQRPVLDTSIAGDQQTHAQADIMDRPASDASILQAAVPAERTLKVVGAVDAIWAEVELSAGGVGYIERTAFDVPSPLVPAPVVAPVADGSGSSDAERSALVLRNDCNQATQIWLRYQSGEGWITEGPWNYRADERSYPTISNAKRYPITNEIYLYAINQSGVKWTGNYTAYLNGKSFNMIRANVNKIGSDYEIRLTC